MNDLLSTEETGEALGLKPATVRVYVKHKRLNPHVKKAGAWWFHRTEIERFQRERRERGNPDWIAQKAA